MLLFAALFLIDAIWLWVCILFTTGWKYNKIWKLALGIFIADLPFLLMILISEGLFKFADLGMLEGTILTTSLFYGILVLVFKYKNAINGKKLIFQILSMHFIGHFIARALWLAFVLD